MLSRIFSLKIFEYSKNPINRWLIFNLNPKQKPASNDINVEVNSKYLLIRLFTKLLRNWLVSVCLNEWMNIRYIVHTQLTHITGKPTYVQK